MGRQPEKLNFVGGPFRVRIEYPGLDDDYEYRLSDTADKYGGNWEGSGFDVISGMREIILEFDSIIMARKFVRHIKRWVATKALRVEILVDF